MLPGTLAAPNTLEAGARNRPQHRRAILTFLRFVLPSIAVTHAACTAQPSANPTDVFTPGVYRYFSQINFPAVEPKLRALQITIAPHFPRKESPARRAEWITCGWGITNPATSTPRVTKLPPDPVLVLANSYLKCKSIRSAQFDPQVSVADYPAGHFGDHEYAGLLVPAWIEFSDETDLRKIFHTLASLADGPDSFGFSLAEMEDPEVNLTDYRRASDFSPELLVEFVGGTNLKIELNFTQGRMLIEVETRWDFYSLNQHQAGLLRQIITGGQSNPPGR